MSRQQVSRSKVVALTPDSENFDWGSTTPQSEVGTTIQASFWSCSKEFELFSTRGIVPIGNARLALTDLSFVEELPVIPEAMAETGLIKRLRESGDLQAAQIDDIVWILDNSKSTRTPDQLVSQQLSLSVLRADRHANELSAKTPSLYL